MPGKFQMVNNDEEKQEIIDRKKTQVENNNVCKYAQVYGVMILIALLSIIGIIVYHIYIFIHNYYNNVEEHRDEIDMKNTSVYHKWTDFTTNEVVNCSDTNNCIYSCEYIQTHFHKTPDECKYKDHKIIVDIIVVVILVIVIINCIGNFCKSFYKK